MCKIHLDPKFVFLSALKKKTTVYPRKNRERPKYLPPPPTMINGSSLLNSCLSFEAIWPECKYLYSVLTWRKVYHEKPSHSWAIIRGPPLII